MITITDLKQLQKQNKTPLLPPPPTKQKRSHMHKDFNCIVFRLHIISLTDN